MFPTFSHYRIVVTPAPESNLRLAIGQWVVCGGGGVMGLGTWDAQQRPGRKATGGCTWTVETRGYDVFVSFLEEKWILHCY